MDKLQTIVVINEEAIPFIKSKSSILQHCVNALWQTLEFARKNFPVEWNSYTVEEEIQCVTKVAKMDDITAAMDALKHNNKKDTKVPHKTSIRMVKLESEDGNAPPYSAVAFGPIDPDLDISLLTEMEDY